MASRAADLSDIAEPDRIEGRPHPREAARLIGHAAAEQTLLRAANTRLPHAWIFGGPPGVGKATLAYRFAKALLARGRSTAPLASLNTETNDPAIRRILAGAHPDLLVLRRPYDQKTGKLKGELPVDEVRRLASFYARHSGEGGMRIAIVDSADDLKRNAANALLKTLEEPPPGGLLILIAHRPRALLPTIRSRCRMLMLGPLPESDVEHGLATVAPDLKDAATLARLSEGSIGGALDMAALDAAGLDAALQSIARKRHGDPNAAHALANDLAAAAAAPRFRLFLSRVQAAFADAAGQGDRAALDAYDLATSLARAEDALNTDKRAIVLRLLDRYAALARVA